MFHFDNQGNISSLIPNSPPASPVGSPRLNSTLPTLSNPVGTLPTLSSPLGSDLSSPRSGSGFSDVSVGSWGSQTSWNQSDLGMSNLTLENRLQNAGLAQEYADVQFKEQALKELRDVTADFEQRVNLIQQQAARLALQTNYLGDEPKLLVVVQVLKNNDIPALEADYAKYKQIMAKIEDRFGLAMREFYDMEGRYQERFQQGLYQVHQALYNTFSGLTNANTPRVVLALNEFFEKLQKYGTEGVYIEADKALMIDNEVIREAIQQLKYLGEPRDSIIQHLVNDFKIDPTMAGFLVDLN